MIDFSQAHKFGLLFFVGLLFICTGTYLYKSHFYGSAFTYSVDFTGGTQVQLAFSEPISGEEVLKALEDAGYKNALYRSFSPRELLVRVKELSTDLQGTTNNIKGILEQKFPTVEITIRQTDTVGASVSGSLWRSCLKATLLGLLVMLLYILGRGWALGFALGAVGSLFHDALLMVTVCLIFNFEISISVFIAILTVLGYSINDTIIIFSRIRENSSRFGHTYSLPYIVNISINETLRRTFLTSISTLLAILPLVFFGGEVLKTLSIMLLIGIIFGTYSSICVASPIMLFFTRSSKAC